MNQDLQIDVSQVMSQALATGLFISRCTVQFHDSTVTDSGQPTLGDEHWFNSTTLTNLRCMLAPLQVNSIDANERKTVEQELSYTLFHCLLEGYRPQIDTSMRAVVDFVVYDILGVESDSQKQMTRLKLQIATI